MATLQCEIVTPERKLFSSDATFVVLPAAEGEMGVYAKHEPVVTTLKSGSVRVTEAEAAEPTIYMVAGGYAQVEADRVIILADRALAKAEIDKDAAAAEVENLKERLSSMSEDDPGKAFVRSELEWNELLLAHA